MHRFPVGHLRAVSQLVSMAESRRSGGSGYRSATRRHVHVAASLYHDITPCNELGLTSIWINRQHEIAAAQPTAELPDLTRIPEVLEELVPQ